MQNHKRVRIEHHGQTHAHAFCTQCEWIAEDRVKGSHLATKHAKDTGHSVKVEKGYSYTVIPTDDNPARYK